MKPKRTSSSGARLQPATRAAARASGAQRRVGDGARPTPLTPSDAGEVRIGPLLPIPDVLEGLHVAPRRAFRKAGVRAGLFANSENRLSFHAVCRLMAACAELAGREDFGLLVGDRFTLKDLGVVGQLMRNAPTVGEALRELELRLHVHDRGAVPVLIELNPSTALVGYNAYLRDLPSTFEVYDLVVAMGRKTLRELCGPTWRPMWVQFAHTRPSELAPYRRLFGPNVRFDAELSGLAFASSWLRRRIPDANPALYASLRAAVESAEARSGIRFADKAYLVINQMLLTGTASARNAARLFGMHERTLRKRLASEGTAFQDLLDHARFELAQQLLRNTQLAVSEIAEALHYADANVFSRAFRAWSGVSPTQWRVRNAPRPAP